MEKIDRETLVNFFESEEFLRALNIAGSATYKTGHETAFWGYMIEGKPQISRILEGLTESVLRAGFPFVNPNTRIIRQGLNPVEIEEPPLLDFHFHPEPQGKIFPSPEDLHPYFIYYDVATGERIGGYPSEFEYHPLIGIGRIDNNRTIEFLLVRQTNPAQLSSEETPLKVALEVRASEFLGEILSELVSANTTEEVVEILRKTEIYHADVLYLKDGRLSEVHEKILAFAF